MAKLSVLKKCSYTELFYLVFITHGQLFFHGEGGTETFGGYDRGLMRSSHSSSLISSNIEPSKWKNKKVHIERSMKIGLYVQ